LSTHPKALILTPPIVQAIIFLAPLSFNQVLEEDRQVNRLEDSIYLWKEVCSNPLLARANIILFLNKMDILQKTLAAGIKVATYVPSYGNTPNDVENVTKYFKEKFRAYHVCPA
jgi:guanine nucleotide-binding protein subunit alpha